VKPAFKIREADRDGLDALFGAEVLQAFFLDLVDGSAILALFFGFEIEFFEFVVGEGEKITKFSGHESP